MNSNESISFSGHLEHPNRVDVGLVLEHFLLSGLIKQGKLTLGAIKPELQGSVKNTSLEGDDDVLRNFLLSKIPNKLIPLCRFDRVMPEYFWAEFYGEESVQRQLQVKPIEALRYGMDLSNRWEEAMAWMTNAKTTWLLLFHHSGNAVDFWRNAVGPAWQLDVLEQQFSTSLRYQFQAGEHNSLFHSADSIKAAKREIELLRNYFRGEHAW